MKIVHIITRLIVGGAQENTLLSCEGQHERGHDVTLITGPPLGPEGSLMQRAQSGGYATLVFDEMRRAIHPSRDSKTYFRLVRCLRDLRPDIVHTHSSKAGVIGRWAAHRAGVSAVIHTIHGLSFTASTSPWVNRSYRFLERRAARISTRIICVADAMREQSLAAHIGRPGQYVTVYSGMETRPFLDSGATRDVVRQRLGIAPSDLIVGTIARLFELKGHEDIIACAPDLCRRFPQLRFMWVGDGLLRESYERQIAALGLTDRFILTGLVPPERVPELTGAMDILLHPSRREGLARALPQAGLAGKPAITYDIDGAKEGVLDGSTGFVIPAFDREQLANSLATLVADPARRIAMGSAGRVFAARRFDATTMIDAIEQVYEVALGDARRGATSAKE